MSKKLVVILGPTAVGKTKFAVQLANKFNGEIISADSRQVYKSMDVGTGKDIDEYRIDGNKIPFHLIDVINPTDEYDLFKFQKCFYSSFNKITDRNKTPFLVGGTGLYIHSVLKNYQLVDVDFNSNRGKELAQLSLEELTVILKGLATNLHNTTDIVDKERIIKAILIAENKSGITEDKTDIDHLVIGVNEEREIIKARITTRLKYRLKNGMIEEVENLVADGITFEKLNYFGLEYKYVGQYLQGNLSYNDMYQKLNSSIHQFAKRQMTWFRKMEREGVKINWMKFDEFERAKLIISNFLSN
ncbi:MAG: tRNA (adenosine(37)-N6)-dimethylallyltransferase MiaA [Melioribacteraceae bacterium]|jgi:tRNA dimethylallyltransferase|nr:tRNA (adenosine(37)-N6)-dimethylallyltransferase MiaA [Melioribacteraceae bacterium]